MLLSRLPLFCLLTRVKSIRRLVISIFCLGFCLFIGANAHLVVAQAESNTLRYEGRLLDRNRNAITAEHSFRFSLWNSADFVPAHLTGAGAIDTANSAFVGWQEEQNIIPNPNGTFSIQLGSVTPFVPLDPNLTYYLQVEVKPSANPITAYQLLDPTGDNGADSNDRKLLDAAPYAKYADSATNAQQTDNSLFIIDADDTANAAGSGTVRLQFGNTLMKYLQYDLDNGYFFFNDNVRIAGNLTVDGLINGIDITTLASGSTHGQNTDSGTTSSTFLLNSGGNSLLLSSVGLSTNRSITFPDADLVVVGEDTSQTLTNKTIDGDQNTLSNIDRDALKDRNRTFVLMPQMDSISIEEDGNGNTASLNRGFDNGNKQQYYALTSQEPALQNLDIVMPFIIPDDFSGWQATPIDIDVRTTSLDPANARLDINMEDSLNSSMTLAGASGLVSTVTSDSWHKYTLGFVGSPTFYAGGNATLRIKLSARSGNRAILGPIRLHYIGK